MCEKRPWQTVVSVHTARCRQEAAAPFYSLGFWVGLWPAKARSRHFAAQVLSITGVSSVYAYSVCTRGHALHVATV